MCWQLTYLLICKQARNILIQVQSEYAKTAYAAFVAHATKMGELYSDLAKAAFRPVELPFANLLGTK
jgi:Phasin protein